MENDSTVIYDQLMRMEEQQETETIPPEIVNLMKEFNDVFDKPKGLPPSRGHEHGIQWIACAKPFK